MAERDRQGKKARAARRIVESKGGEPPGASAPLAAATTLRAVLPALAMGALALVPSLSRGERLATWGAAALSAIAVVLLSRRAPFTWEPAVHRPHYMQALTQAGVFVVWGLAWEPVGQYLVPLAIQLAFAYQVALLLAWWRRRPFALGFGPLPIVFSINLFLWFRDAYFGWQLFLVAISFLGKELVQWERGGRRRHVFNPSSFGLAVISAGLLLLGATDTTLAREIATTQESAPWIFEGLFLLGLIVQLQFPVVLVTMSAAVTTWILGVIWLRATGVYMFQTTDIPAAVFLGMLLLVTDPATSPESRTGKALFGASYGALVFVLFPLLEAWGGYGYFDKLLPLPILNLLVRRFDRLGRRWGARLEKAHQALFERREAPSPLRTRLATVGAWVAIALALYSADAVGEGHGGRDVAFWRAACFQDRIGACRSLFELGTRACDGGQITACHDLAVDLEELERKGRKLGTSPDVFFERACRGGLAPSCAILAERRAGAPNTHAAMPAESAQGPQAVEALCRSGNGEACHTLAQAHLQGMGIARDPDKARELFDLGCRAGLVQSCSSYAALQMERGDVAPKGEAARAFDRACRAGDAPGCVNLALMYLTGDGVEVDAKRAAELHRKACDMDLGVACDRLADAYAQGLGVTADPQVEAQLRRKACERGYAPSCR